MLLTQAQREEIIRRADAGVEDLVDSVLLQSALESDGNQADVIAQAVCSSLQWLDATMDSWSFTPEQIDHVLIKVHRALDKRMELGEWIDQWQPEGE